MSMCGHRPVSLANLALAGLAFINADFARAQVLPVITSTTVSGNTLTINGAAFGSDPKVTLGATALAVSSSSATQIVAASSQLSSLTPGNYLLTVNFKLLNATSTVTLVAASGPRVVDSAGHSYPVEQYQLNARVPISVFFLTPDGVVTTVVVNPTLLGTAANYSTQIWYTSTNCSGTPYFLSLEGYFPFTGTYSFGSAYVESGVLYYPQPGAGQTLTGNSYYLTGYDTCTQSTFPNGAFSAIESLNLSNYFVPPFSLVLQ